MKTKKKQPRRGKHVPQRTCVGCRTVQAKRSLTRIVRTPAGVLIDTQGKMPGRGAYLHDLTTCWEKGLKGSLARSLKTELTDEDRQRLHEYMQSLAEQESLETPPQAAALAEQ